MEGGWEESKGWGRQICVHMYEYTDQSEAFAIPCNYHDTSERLHIHSASLHRIPAPMTIHFIASHAVHITSFPTFSNSESSHVSQIYRYQPYSSSTYPTSCASTAQFRGWSHAPTSVCLGSGSLFSLSLSTLTGLFPNTIGFGKPFSLFP